MDREKISISNNRDFLDKIRFHASVCDNNFLQSRFPYKLHSHSRALLLFNTLPRQDSATFWPYSYKPVIKCGRAMMNDPRDMNRQAEATIRGLFFPEPKYEMITPSIPAEMS